MHPMVERALGKGLVVHQWIYERSDGRLGASLAGRPMLLLRTVGRRTGEPRTSALLYVRDGDELRRDRVEGRCPEESRLVPQSRQ